MRAVTGESVRFVHSWVMYAGVATTVCRLDFHTLDAQGVPQPVDRLQALGYDDRPWWKIPKDVRRLRSVKEVDAQGRKICQNLGRGTDLRVEAWCGSRSFWVQRRFADENVCVASGGRR